MESQQFSASCVFSNKFVSSSKQCPGSLKLPSLLYMLAIFSSSQGFTQQEEGESLWLDELEQTSWVTVSNMKQDSRDVSASVTVFTREDIEHRQFRDLFDVLRSVPGMTVARKSAPISTIDHASNTKNLGRGFEIEVNGIPQSMAAHSTAVMEFLPPIEIIDRVEVVRGSNATADGGSRSFKGTIKITTRSPEYGDQSNISVRSDSLDRHSGFAYYNNQHDKHHLSLSAHYSQDEGFDEYTPENTPTPAPKSAREDDTTTQYYLLQYANTLSTNSELRIDASYMNGEFQNPGRSFSLDGIVPGVSTETTALDASTSTMDYGWVSASYAQGNDAGDELIVRLSHQDWRWRLDWPVCGPRGLLSQEAKTFALNRTDEFAELLAGNPEAVTLSPELLALGFKLLQPGQTDTVCGYWPLGLDLNLTTARIQKTTVFKPNVKWLFGLEGNRNSIQGDTWDKNTYNTSRAYTHLQWSLDDIVVNAGASNEHFSGRDAVSSRLGLNYHIDNNKTLRFALAKGKKIPDAADLENGLGQLYLITPEPVEGSTDHVIYDGSDLNKNTDPQTVYNQEIGFAWRPSRRDTFDMRLFKDRYTNASFYDLFLVKIPRSGSMEKKGAEFQYNAIDGVSRYGFTAHYHLSEAAHLSEDYRATGGSAYYTTYLAGRYDLSFNVYISKYNVDEVNWVEERYNRDSKIFEVQLGQKFTEHFYGALLYRFDDSHFVSNLYLPDIYTTDYKHKHSVGIKLKLTL